MPKINDMFPSNYLKAADIDDDVVVTILEIKEEEIGDDAKHVVYFNELEKGLVLNKTNAESIATTTGSDDTDNWPGQKITLFATTVSFQGKPVEAIRVKLRKPKTQGKTTNKPMPQRTLATAAAANNDTIDDSDVPF